MCFKLLHFCICSCMLGECSEDIISQQEMRFCWPHLCFQQIDSHSNVLYLDIPLLCDGFEACVFEIMTGVLNVPFSSFSISLFERILRVKWLCIHERWTKFDKELQTVTSFVSVRLAVRLDVYCAQCNKRGDIRCLYYVTMMVTDAIMLGYSGWTLEMRVYHGRHRLPYNTILTAIAT